MDTKEEIKRQKIGADQAYTERVLNLNDQNSNGTVREIRFDSIHIMRISLNISDRLSIPFIADEPTVILFFCLKGNSVLHLDTVEKLDLKASTHNVVHISPSKGRIECRKGEYDVFYIGLNPEMFKNYFPRGIDMYEGFSEQMDKIQLSLLRKEHGIVNHNILKAIEDITRADSSEPIKKIFLKAKVIELLSLQLGELCTVCNPRPTVKSEDVERMYQVKSFILKHLGSSYSLQDLAKLVGTNDYTLKKEFKQLFGTTVFGFWSDAKMEKAQKLLTETRLGIKEVSQIIGYKNPQHFTTAFKRKFGLTPSQFRKNHE